MTFKHVLTSSLLLVASSLLPQSATADWQTPGPTNADPQNIVIVVAENPNSNS